MFHIILASHNRVKLTARVIRQLVNVFKRESQDFNITLFDDASTDSTVREVRDIHPEIAIISGDGHQFWSRGMAAAEKHSLENCTCHQNCWIVWVNDDIKIYEEQFAKSLRHVLTHSDAIHVGAFKATSTGQLSYSGYNKAGPHPLAYKYVTPDWDEQPVDTFSGNLVFVPTLIARKIGGINNLFPHALGDVDYGLRAKQVGCQVFLLGNFQGECEPNVIPDTSLRVAIRTYFSVKGAGNIESQLVFFRTHYGGPTMLPICWSFLSFLVREVAKILQRLKSRAVRYWERSRRLSPTDKRPLPNMQRRGSE